MRDNSIQFAVVREDPELELAVLRRFPARRALLIASGGCTALTLGTVLPDLELDLVDPNPAQLDLVRAKVHALTSLSGYEQRARFNVETSDTTGLSECGNFESLFRCLRTFLNEFVLPREELRAIFEEPDLVRTVRERLFDQRYWTLAFELFFADSMLVAMFGPEATQYAEPGSYAAYFRRAFEDGLTRDGARSNPFLHHVFLGHYLDREDCLPSFLVNPAEGYEFSYLNRTIDDEVDLSRYDLIDLSNIFDWMEPRALSYLFRKLQRETRSGAVVMWRQLNNTRNLEQRLSKEFAFDARWQRELIENDRSLFYSSVHIGVRN